MGIVLRKTFEAEHMWVHTQEEDGKPGVKLDCMFFKAYQDEEEATKDYKELPTIIMCNSNAMFYQ